MLEVSVSESSDQICLAITIITTLATYILLLRTFFCFALYFVKNFYEHKLLRLSSEFGASYNLRCFVMRSIFFVYRVLTVYLH